MRIPSTALLAALLSANAAMADDLTFLSTRARPCSSKHTHVFRIVDKKRNTLAYVAISDKFIEGSLQNAISTVPVVLWAAH